MVFDKIPLKKITENRTQLQESKANQLGFHPQTQKLEPPCTVRNKQHHKIAYSVFHLNGHIHTVKTLQPPSTG